MLAAKLLGCAFELLVALTALTGHILGKYKAVCQTNKALANLKLYKAFHESQREGADVRDKSLLMADV